MLAHELTFSQFPAEKVAHQNEILRKPKSNLLWIAGTGKRYPMIEGRAVQGPKCPDFRDVVKLLRHGGCYSPRVRHSQEGRLIAELIWKWRNGKP